MVSTRLPSVTVRKMVNPPRALSKFPAHSVDLIINALEKCRQIFLRGQKVQYVASREA